MVSISGPKGSDAEWMFSLEHDKSGTVRRNIPPPASLPTMTLSSREEAAAHTALRRLPELVRAVDQERVDDVLRSSIAAAIALQPGARAQAELLANRIGELLATVPMHTASELGRKAGSSSGKPDALVAQWASRGQVFSVELAGHGLRYPAFQFQPDSGKPWPVLAKVLPALRKAFAPLDLLAWFHSPHPALNQQAPVSKLHDPPALQGVVDASLAPADFW